MLDPWQIEEIKKREEEKKQEQNRPRVEIEVPMDDDTRRKNDGVVPGEPRGVEIIDLNNPGEDDKKTGEVGRIHLPNKDGGYTFGK